MTKLLREALMKRSKTSDDDWQHNVKLSEGLSLAVEDYKRTVQDDYENMKWEGYEGILREARKNPLFYQATLKEGMYSDVAYAIAGMHREIVEHAKPAAIGRDMAYVVPTTENELRFFKSIAAKAYIASETGVIKIGEKYDTVDVPVNIEVKADASWTEDFVEDASWPVLERQIAELGRVIRVDETERILALLVAIDAGDLASGVEITTNEGTSFVWADITSLWTAVKTENFNPDVLAIHPREAEGLLNDDKFINALYYGPERTKRTGEFETTLNMTILVSSLVPAVDATHNYKFCLDSSVVVGMPVRRDLLTKPYEDPANQLYGVVASSRFGLGVLRPDAVARGV